ncbi:hypothetical protein PS834_03759 [Pseudomonas fluorescens]|nr:hypothetical protein PS834_03759 [Pseudomonas fluorescens]
MDRTELLKILETAKSGGQRVEVSGLFNAGLGTTNRVGLVESFDAKSNNYTLYGSVSQGCLVMEDRETLDLDKTNTAKLIGPPPAPQIIRIQLPEPP